MQQIITGYEHLGLTLYADFITPEEETVLLDKLNSTYRKKSTAPTARASIQRFGSKAPYNSFVQSKYIPDYLESYSQRLLDNNLLPARPDSVSVNEYDEGQTIQPHVDNKNSGAVITVLSLESPAVMRFQYERDKFDVELPARCLVQLREEIREKWLHSILPVPGHRYSVVFRRSGDI
jgi:alkylated DNA repair dioxygenase AlkB